MSRLIDICIVTTVNIFISFKFSSFPTSKYRISPCGNMVENI